MSRIKNPVRETTREEVESLVNQIAVCLNTRREIAAAKDAQKLAIDEAFASELSSLDETIKKHTALVQQWAEAHPAEFVKRKSIDFASGTIGFRTGTPKLKTIRTTKWEAVLEALRLVKRLHAYIRTEETVAKDKLLTDYANSIVSGEDLATIGLKVVQEESFFVEPMLDKPETRASAPSPEAA